MLALGLDNGIAVGVDFGYGPSYDGVTQLKLMASTGILVKSKDCLQLLRLLSPTGMQCGRSKAERVTYSSGSCKR